MLLPSELHFDYTAPFDFMLRDHNCLIEGFSFTDLNFVFLDSVSFNFEENRYPLGAVVDRMNKYRREMQVLKCPWHHRVIDIKIRVQGLPSVDRYEATRQLLHKSICGSLEMLSRLNVSFSQIIPVRLFINIDNAVT